MSDRSLARAVDPAVFHELHGAEPPRRSQSAAGPRPRTLAGWHAALADRLAAVEESLGRLAVDPQAWRVGVLVGDVERLCRTVRQYLQRLETAKGARQE
jgi:hypothetical protein